MELKQLRYFLTICEEKNISKAAKKLFMSQPPLSQQLKNLEDELGCELFKRSTRSLEITEAGRVLEEKARQLLELSDNLINEIKSEGNRVSGTLKVGFVASSGATLLPDRIPMFYKEYPQINFQIKEGSTHRILELLDSGVIEIGVVRTPFNIERYNFVELSKEPMIAIGTKHFLDDNLEDIVGIEKLKDIPIILDKRFRKLIATACGKKGFVPNILCEGEDSRSMIVWASSGLGIAIIPKSLESVIGSNNLMVKKIEDKILETNTVIVWDKKRALTPVAKCFLETFRVRNV